MNNGYISVYPSFTKRLLSQQNALCIEKIYIKKQLKIALSNKGQIYSINYSDVLTLTMISISCSISQISCNSTAALFVSSIGQVYSYGEDPKNLGFLGTGRHSAINIELIPELSYITQVSLGKSHAGALSEQGALYLWGTCASTNNFITPSHHNFDLFTVHEFECGNNYTLILTPGGYVYVIGQLGFTHHHTINHSTGIISPPELEKMCAVKARSGKNFVACLMETGDVYSFDGCMDLVKLPAPSYQKIEDIQIVGEKVLGFCESNYLLE